MMNNGQHGFLVINNHVFGLAYNAIFTMMMNITFTTAKHWQTSLICPSQPAVEY
ncbi:hypothetical protein [Vibrio vulnificus YJ016]|uniref:Uncharacterized protein n=1 Tax=Vibrio vulnificus (strain YJ016) TaxID=196600 RepID=Q7MLY3_VIBVY|nr:hypothetical protein [Vibrio vulnificus YJ016]